MGRFWEDKPLEALSSSEWEQLCDGCGRCCLNKLEDVDTGDIFYTNVACRLLRPKRCSCRHYATRHKHVPDCLTLSPDTVYRNPSLPASCAYRRLAEGRPLAEWHPLLSGNPDSVHEAGISVRGRTISEEWVDEDQLESHIVTWFDDD